MEYVLKLAPLPISDTGELEHNLEIHKEGIDNAPIYRDLTFILICLMLNITISDKM